MKALRTGILGTATAVAIFAFPPVSTAEYYVPPGNSAVNQYTESVPTAGGQKNVGKGKKAATPQKVLGAEKTKRLSEQGEQGRKAAEVAATTAPRPVVAEPDSPDSEPGQAGGGGTGSGQGGGGGPGNQAAPEQQPGASEGGDEGGSASAAEASGSSGLGEVLGHATGSSSGGMGLLLPLILIAALVWAALMFRRQRSRPAP